MLTWDTTEGLADLAEIQAGRAVMAARIAASGVSRNAFFEMRNLRARAGRIGLSFWPALFCRDCTPAAFVAAEEVLTAKIGARWGEFLPDGTRSHGGWDSTDYYGLSSHTVVKMWIAAGCRDGEKFRLQVFYGEVAKKGDSIPWLRNYFRGLQWLTNNHIRLPLAREAIAALGRLSPESRRAALAPFFGPGLGDHRGKIRIRHLDWGAVRHAQSAVAGGNVKARAALSGIRRAAQLLGVKPYELSRTLCPVYALPLPFARRVALGESPAQLAGGLLSRAESHKWAIAGAPEIAGWLSAQLALPAHRSIRVIRWLDHCRRSGRWDAVERDRIARIPGENQGRRYSLLSVLDEIQEEDIATGKDGVDAVLQRTAARLGDAWLTTQMGDHRILAPLPAWARNLPEGVRILRTPAQLAKEGLDMNHCVGGYRDAVSNGQSHILAIQTRHGRSTAEIRPDLSVSQHRAERNESPCSRNEKLLRAFLARVTSKGVRNAA